ncbi:terminase [Streptomyces erythrochromogenes]|uniref:terminase n=1 Tax=Streptomyces erythrochromogenes TaxID=285574 RepID=UPI0022529B67|nr:terminase [Streptomyces erythrochromogenes]MCX5584273.1 terminase [Streptomyces erythrochromogenes]
MTSLLDAPRDAAPDPTGAQRPRLYVAPPFLSSSGQEAVELAALAGLQLDPWQQHILDVGLGERADGRWAAFEVAVNVPRQNGKGGVIEARELAGLFLLGEQLILHSAHEFKTAIEAFRRVTALVTNSDYLRKRVARVRRTTGEESIELLSGQRLRFLARSGGSGRGFSGDCNILDEAMILGDEAMGALLPTMSARPNPQIWYLGSAGIGGPSVQLARLRERAIGSMEGGTADPSLAYFEWSVEPHLPECPADCAAHDDAGDPASWARANPAMGIRISEEHVERERLSMSSQVFARERLGAGDYPSDSANTWSVIGQDAWRALTDGESKPSDPVAFAIDMTPERSHAAICVAGSSGAAVHVEVVDHRPGMGWIVDRAVDLQERWGPCAWVVDGGGPAGALIPDLERAGLKVTVPKVRDIAQACGQFYDAVTEQTLVHLDQAPLAAALAGARKRDLGEAWAWARRGVSVDISPLVAVTLAAWGLRTRVDEEEEPEPWVAYM